MARNAAILGAFLVGYGCQTVPTDSEARIPPAYAAIFASCGDLDGAVKLTWFTDDVPGGSAEAEWRSGETSLEVDIVSPIGQALVTLKGDGDTIAVTGPMRARVPPLTIGDNGYVEVDGYTVAIRPTELACFALGTLPDSWLNSLKAVTNEDEARTRIWIGDDNRTVRVTVFGDHQGRSLRYCARLTWGGFLGMFERQMYFCHHPDAVYAGTLKVSDYTLKWVPLDIE